MFVIVRKLVYCVSTTPACATLQIPNSLRCLLQGGGRVHTLSFLRHVTLFYHENYRFYSFYAEGNRCVRFLSSHRSVRCVLAAIAVVILFLPKASPFVSLCHCGSILPPLCSPCSSVVLTVVNLHAEGIPLIAAVKYFLPFLIHIILLKFKQNNRCKKIKLLYIRYTSPQR